MSKPNDVWKRGRGRGRGTGESRGIGTAQLQSFRQNASSVQRGWRTSGLGRGRGSAPTSSDTTPSPMAGKRQMELIPSVSRSSGLDKDGDSLKNPRIQEEYRSFVEEKLEKVLQRHENLDSETEEEKKHRVEEQENVLILFRKLREGISSSGRIDDFSVEVYERSLYLSVLFASPKHAMAIIPALLNDVYKKTYSATPPTATEDIRHRYISLLVSLIHDLTTQYPSQNLYRQQLASVPHDWIPEPTRNWLKALAFALSSGNYHQFGILTSRERVTELLKLADFAKSTAATKLLIQLHDKLAMDAFTFAIDTLRIKARAGTWKIMRSAFRELWFEEQFDTRHWLCRSLTFDATGPRDKFDLWLSNAEESGEIKRKEGFEGRWVVTKVQ